MDRSLRLIGGLLTALLVVSSVLSCATTPPAPTAGSAKPTVASAPAAKSTEPAKSPATPASSPAAKSESSASKAAAPADWKSQWDAMVAAAKKEGKLVLAGPRGDLFRAAAMEFQKAYPEIQVEYTGAQGNTFAPRILAERDAGQYLWDVHIGGSDSLAQLKQRKVLDPLKPSLILPEVVDDSKWLGGLDDAWLDLQQQYIFAFMAYLYYGAYVNRNLAPESQLSKFEQLIDPQWKGKIAMQDPRRPGAGSVFNGYIVIMKGDNFLRSLLNQNIIVVDDPRQMLEGVIRGAYPIAMGLTQSDLQDFKTQGLTDVLRPLDTNNLAATQLASGSGSMAIIEHAPHPNVARVFANWVLSKEGQTAYVKNVNQSVRRLDVPNPGEDAPRPGIQYISPNKERYEPEKAKAVEIAKDLIK